MVAKVENGMIAISWKNAAWLGVLLSAPSGTSGHFIGRAFIQPIPIESHQQVLDKLDEHERRLIRVGRRFTKH